MSAFEPSLGAARARLAAVAPDAYARTRNALGGAVTRLSPYLTHGLLGLREVYDAVHARHPLDAQHKFVFELGWRAYYRHVWAHLGDGIHQSLRTGLLPDDSYQTEVPIDVRQACTGIPVIDLAVRELYETGYLHNHARMWLASYLVHLRKVHWHTGAQWMLGHLLDGDVASNHLSWQWVAGTGSSKPYLFNADNVARYAPARWHSPGTLVDTSYEALDELARAPAAVQPCPDGTLIETPAVAPERFCVPPGGGWTAPDAGLLGGRDVWLLHPWSVRCLAPAPTSWVLLVGVGLAAAHTHRPWTARRWDFVTRAMQEQTPHLWWTEAAALAGALAGARSVRWHPDPHIDAFMTGLQSEVAQPEPAPALFAPVHRYCSSFSKWWGATHLLS